MIWILWGMWPTASVNFYTIFIKIVTQKYHVQKNDDFPYMILNNIPVEFPRFDVSTGSSPWIEKSISKIKHAIDTLSQSGVSIYAMPCNTFHLYTDELRDHIGNRWKFISMIDAVIENIHNDGYKHIGILWTETTIQLWLYQNKLKNHNIYILSRVWQKKTVEVIENVIAEKTTHEDVLFLQQSIEKLYQNWAECVILWCTELPIIAQQISDTPVPLYNPLEILAEKIAFQHFHQQ